MADVYFNARKLPKSQNEYVAFIDIMGTRTHMKVSVGQTANFIFKLHAAIIQAWREKPYRNVFVYPVMDGAYITAGNKEDIENIVVRIYRSLYEVFIKEKESRFYYLVRGAIAYGEVIHGHHVPYNASKAFEMSLGYKDNILLGSAMINAYDGENKVAPFGVYIDESAIKRGQAGKTGAFPVDWKWYNSSTLKVDPNTPSLLRQKIKLYLEEMKDEHHPLHYETAKIEKHLMLTDDYFGI